MPKSASKTAGETRAARTAPRTALYRAYRPHSFTDVIGQDHIVKVLQASITSGRVAHAYLFAGSRGTGKTSVARIFARALETTDNDIYEIDAASNRGIDDIRAIRDGVAVSPLESPYKVYIVDEAHMLTKEAFNALLKTLEEPPSHAIFILATTEFDKLPETIVSRCQSFSFKKPSREILRTVVTAVAKKEGFTLESGAGDLIAMLGDGSFRDALGTLQKIVGSITPTKTSANSPMKITLADVELVTGAPRNVLVNDFVSALVAGDVSRALAALSAADESAVDMKFFITLVLEKARAILLLKIGSSGEGKSSDKKSSVDELFSAEDAVFLRSLAADPKSRLNSAALALLLRAYDDTGRAAIPTLPLELATIDILGQK
jgi:DNA polymerase-3 subunit gamma/tau